MDDDAGWGPSVEGRHRRRLGRLFVLLLVILLAVTLIVPMIVSARIPRQEVAGLASSGEPLHVLVVGSDSREGLTAEERRELSTGSGIEGERTDSIFVMSMADGEVALLAFPRDLWVTRCDGSVGRINVAQSIGGPGCLVATVRELSGLDIQHHVSVTFGGFRDIIDAIGGVELCLDEPIADDDAGIDLPAGCQQLDGQDALGYVRVRKIDNDLERIKRQQRFVRALAAQTAQPATLLNPARLLALSGEIGDAIVVDEAMGPLDLLRLAWEGRGIASGDIAAHTVPSDPGVTSGGAQVLYLREDEAEALFETFRSGSVLERVERDVEEAVSPADVAVTVLNATDVGGLASQVSVLLEDRGFEIERVGNAAAPRETSLVRHPPGDRAAAEAVVADLLNQPEFEETSAVDSITLLLGDDAGALA